MRLAVDAIGAFSSVGLNVPQTMGSLRTRLALFTELPIFGNDGEPLVGAPAPLQTELASAWERRVAMGAFALAECAQGAAEEPLPLLLCTSEAEDDATFGAFLRRLGREARVALEPTLSAQVPGGHAAVGPALQQAHALLASGRSRACYVGAADSLLERGRLERLSQSGRVKHENASDAFIPGEAAAFLRVSLRPSSESLAQVTGVGQADEARGFGSGKPSTAQALVTAIKQALAQAGATTEDVAVIGQDVTGERYFFSEWSLATTRLKFRRRHHLPTWTAALSVGDIGAALGPLTLAYFSFLLGGGGLGSLQDDGVMRRALLYGACSDEALRSAVILREVGDG
jgi:3-oxoacyl-[acyl-carrier-protein] synthase-1